MPEDIDRTIYKLELDDSGYIRGVESMAASTARLTEQQQKANQTLQINQAALKNASDVLKKAKQDLDNYTGTNVKHQQQLQKDFENAQTEQKKLTDLVAQNQKSYEAATKAAQEFADVSAKANKLQTATGGGKILTGTSLTTPIPELPKIDFTNLSGLPQILAQVSGEFKKIADAVELAKQKVSELSEEDPEFERLTEFIKLGEAALKEYNHAVDLASESTDQLSQRIEAAQVTISKINTANVEELPVEIAKSAEQFNELAGAVALADQRLKEMKPTDTGFDELAKIVAQGKKTLQDFDIAAKNATGGQTSLRTQLRLAREELVKLEQAGKGASKEYLELEQRTAKLTDQFNDQQARIRILASDTKLLDFGKASITAATSAFQAYTSVSILAGGASEQLQKKTMQLFAAMQLLQSLEQLSNLTRREGILSTLGLSGATKIYQAVVGTATGTLKAFRGALLATGIGAAVIAIGFLVKKYIEYRDSIREAQEQQKVFNEVVAEGNKQAGKQLADLKILTQTARDATLPFKERTAAVKELQKEFPDYLGNLKQEQILTGDITVATDELTKSIIASSRARAANKKIDELESQRLDIRQSQAEIEDKIQKNSAEQQKANRKDQRDAEQRGLDQFNAIAKRSELQRDLDDKKNKEAAIDRQEDFLVKSFGLTKLADDREEKQKDAKTKKQTSAIQNEFLQRKAELDKQLADARRAEIEDELSIRADFDAQLRKQLLDIDKALKDKKLTLPESKILISAAIDVNQTQLNKALADFNKKVLEAREKLNDELRSLQEKANSDTINLIHEEFERRKAQIDFNEQKEIDDQKAATEEKLKNLNEEKRLWLITEADYQRARAIIVSTGEQELNNIIQKFSQERQDLSADVFKKSLEAYTSAITAADLIRDQDLAAEVTKQAARFEKGKISFETFQRNITKFQREQEAQRRAGELQVLNDELADLDRHLAAIKDTNSKEFADTKATRDKLAGTIAQKTIEDKTKTVTDKNTVADERTKQILSYTDAVGQLADSVVKFWQQANEAEQKALERSIEIQQRRVDEAQKIAERGNAEYLKQETDRLKELQIARENAARRQLAIDAALQASQLLVAITGAISKIATPGIGVAQVIAEIAIIVGALATGFGLVRSLQGNQPRFKEGTTYLERGKHPQGTDTIPAWLDEGEAVIPKQTNKNYKKSVEAIYHGKVPAEVMNEFVQNYVTKTTKSATEVTKSTKTEDNTYQNFVTNVSKVPTKVINQFITEYLEKEKEEKKRKKFFKGSPEVKAETPAWLTEGEAIIPKPKNRSYKVSVDAIYNNKIPADVLNNFVTKYSETRKRNNIIKEVYSKVSEDKKISDSILSRQEKSGKEHELINIIQAVNDRFDNKVDKSSQYSLIIDRVFSENKSLVENKDISQVAHKVISEVYDKKISLKKVDSLINDFYKNVSIDKTLSDVVLNSEINSIDSRKSFSEDEHRLINITRAVNDRINNKVDKSSEYSSIIDKVFSENKSLFETKNISAIVSKIADEKVTTNQINDLIKRREQKEIFDIINSVDNKLSNKKDERYSSVIDKVFSENKSLVEDKNISLLAKKVINEIYDKKIKRIDSFINDYKKNNLIDTISVIKKLVDDKIENKAISTDLQKIVSNKNVSVDRVIKYSEAINKIFDNEKRKNTQEDNFIINRSASDTSNNIISDKFTTTKNLSTYSKFVENAKQVPAKILNSFINNYQTEKRTEEFKKLFEEKAVKVDAIKKEVIDSSKVKFFNEFVNTYHTIKPIPQPNYEKIKEINETKISHDGKLASIMQEHSQKLDRNNKLQEEMLKALQKRTIFQTDVHYDAEGLAVRQKEIMDQMEKNKRL